MSITVTTPQPTAEDVRRIANEQAQQLRTRYLVAIVLMTCLAIIAVLLITLLRPHDDNTALIGMVFTAILPTTAGMLAILKSGQTTAAVQEVHLAVNSRLSELLEQTAAVQHAAGLALGKIQGVSTTPEEDFAAAESATEKLVEQAKETP